MTELVSLGHTTTLRLALAAVLLMAADGRATATGSMATARYFHTAAVLADGTVLVVGGYGGGGPLASAEIYDPATRTFSPTGNLAAARYLHTAMVLADGTVLVVGGYGVGAYLASAEIYDPATRTFSPTGSLATARYDH